MVLIKFIEIKGRFMTASPYHAVGKRKASIARVYLSEGQHEILVNGRDWQTYFSRATAQKIIVQPLEAVDLMDRFRIQINVRGGGLSGQADAVRHGIARALLNYNPDLRTSLKHLGLLTRDARIKERKKYGQKGARARFQFSKR
jgi:small subunit ribosomal protein S9